MPRSMQRFRVDGLSGSVSIRQLGKYASEIVHELDLLGQPVVVTREGEPAAYLIPVDYAERHLPSLIDPVGRDATR
jgi:antitoxin (DNA-binding transcriptional repressor) of toxin-antitoxin stability system